MSNLFNFMNDFEKEKWFDCWIAVATSINCTKIYVPTDYADEMIKRYRNRLAENNEKEKES